MLTSSVTTIANSQRWTRDERGRFARKKKTAAQHLTASAGRILKRMNTQADAVLKLMLVLMLFSWIADPSVQASENSSSRGNSAQVDASGKNSAEVDASVITSVITSALSAEVETSEKSSAGVSAGVDASANMSGEYRLAPGDRLAVQVFDQAQLSGDFVINGGGQLLLPVIGEVTVGGLTLAEAQKLIQERLADGILVQPTVSLRIAEYRPIFIFGYVQNSGSYPFRFGQSVRAAIASAGGQGRSSQQPNAAISDFIVADERVRLLETRRVNLLVRKGRLVAQQSESPTFVIPQLISFGTDSAKIYKVYTAENELFLSVMDGYRGELGLLQQQRPRIDAEIKAVSEQIANLRRRQAIIKDRVTELADYKARGYVREFVLNEQQREEARAAAEVGNLEAAFARLQREMGDLDIRIEQFKTNFKRQVTTELLQTLQDLRELEASLQTASELRDYKAEDADVTGGAESDSTVLISRNALTFTASYDTLIEPGDVIEVKRKMPKPAGRPGLSTEVLLPRLSVEEYGPRQSDTE